MINNKEVRKSNSKELSKEYLKIELANLRNILEGKVEKLVNKSSIGERREIKESIYRITDEYEYFERVLRILEK